MKGKSRAQAAKQKAQEVQEHVDAVFDGFRLLNGRRVTAQNVTDEASEKAVGALESALIPRREAPELVAEGETSAHGGLRPARLRDASDLQRIADRFGKRIVGFSVESGANPRLKGIQ